MSHIVCACHRAPGISPRQILFERLHNNRRRLILLSAAPHKGKGMSFSHDIRVLLLGILLASGAAGAHAVTCGETSGCVPAQGAYISHFSGPNCTGTESYYLPYDNNAY